MANNYSAATLQSIAKAGGVSIRTVGRALRGEYGVKPRTRAKILQKAKEFDYRPNAIAQNLRLGRTKTVSVIASNLSYEAINKKVACITERASQLGRTISLTIVNNVEEEAEAVEQLRCSRAEGLMIFSLAGPDTCEHIERLARDGFPYVLLDADSNLPFRNVCVDREDAIGKAVQHLLTQGHKHIGVIGASKEEGSMYRRVTRTLVPGVDTEAFVVSNPMRISFFDGYQVVRSNIERIRGVTALIARNDRLALGAMRALKENNIQVPADIAVVGFDNDQAGVYATTSLTTLAQPVEAMAAEAWEMLRLQMRNEATPDIQKIVLPCELVVRESSSARAKSENGAKSH